MIATLWVVDRLLELEPVDWHARLQRLAEQQRAAAEKTEAAKAAERKEGTRPAHPLEAYAGEYEHPGYGTLQVVVEGQGLRFSLNGREGLAEHWHYESFRAAEGDAKGMLATFRTNPKGDVSDVSFLVEPSLPEASFTRAVP